MPGWNRSDAPQLSNWMDICEACWAQMNLLERMMIG
jgi:hypothetical protein